MLGRSNNTAKTLLLLFLLALPATAQILDQETAPERWHVNGNVGFSYNKADQEVQPSNQGSPLSAFLGDVRMNTDGYLLDPKFLHLNGGFDFQRGVTNAELDNMDNSGIAGSIIASFLPRSHIPLAVTYVKTQAGNNGFGLDQSNDYARTSVDWNMLFPKLPKLNIGYDHSSNLVHVANTFADATYKENGVHLGVHDVWAQWQWNFGAGATSSSSKSISGFSLTEPYDSRTRSVNASLMRPFWGEKARLSIDNFNIWRKDTLGGVTMDDTVEHYASSTLFVNPVEKVSTQVGYFMSDVAFQGSSAGFFLPGVGTTVTIPAVSVLSNGVNGRAEYRPLKWLRLAQELRYSTANSPDNQVEVRQSLSESLSTIAVQERWRGFDAIAAYTGHLQHVTTSFDRTNSTWSNDVTTRLSWGNPRLVRLTGIYSRSRLNVVEQIGGFMLQNRARLEAETRHFGNYALLFGVERMRVEYLSFTGDTKQDLTNFDVQLTHPRFSLGVSRNLMDGSGGLFPTLPDRSTHLVNLPIFQLVGTPLLNRTMYATSVNFTLRARRNLDVNGVWRRENNIFSLSHQSLRTLDVFARYRLGKVTLDAGVARFLNDINTPDIFNGNRLNRVYVRIGRDFSLF